MAEHGAHAQLPEPAEMLPQTWREALKAEQQEWISQTLFVRDHLGRPRLTTDLNLWWFPPQPQPVYYQPPASPEPFFACRLFLWMPHRIWRLQLTCPQPSCTGSMAKAGLYRTIRRVLDIDGWYLMATEYLECCQCKKKVAGWSQGIIRQLPPTYSCQFPAVLTYKLSCDLRVVGQLRSGPLGNSAKQLYNNLRELHSDSWMRRSSHYLGVCEQFFCSVSGACPPPLPMPPVPSPACLLTVYGYDMVMRLDEYKALITSTFGTILKIYSSKEVSKKLASAASNADTWITSVGNEHGQVLMSILTCSEGSEGLSAMAAGLMRRYRLADKPPPLVVYVDRDCCSRDGVSKTAALFHEWGNLVVRLDIWHYMRRITCGVTTESHELYPTFMRQLSLCIFEVDPEDARRLKEGKRSELGREHGMFDLSDAEVIQRISKEEWRLHCRHRTRGAEQTALLIRNLLDTFRGPAGRNTLNIPLLDDLRIQDIWNTQMRHLSCIQDPPGVQLYTQTGTLTKGGVSLPVYRCARGATSLQSFHLHLNRFIPGTSVRARYSQAFLVDGVVRWNEDHAARGKTSLRSYSSHLRHALNQKSHRLLGYPLVEDDTQSASYTGELIGLEYLVQQTGAVLEDVSLDPDTPDEGPALFTMEDVDEGTEEDDEDPTFFPPDPSLLLAASQTGSDEPRSGSPLDSAKGSGSQAPPREPSSDTEEEVMGPDGQPGYQHVLKLAKALVEARSLNGLSDSKVDMLISLWQRLPDADKQRQVEGKTTTWPSREPPAVSCSMKVNRTQPNRPESSRLVEAICSQLCRVHPSATRVKGILRTRWSLILADYVSIREIVLRSPRLMAETTIQLFPLNQRNISKWFIGREKRWARPVLKPRPAVVYTPAAIQQAQLPEEEVLLVLVGHGQPYISDVSDVEPGPSSRGLPTLQPIPHQVQVPATFLLSPNIQLLPGLPVVPRLPAYRKRKAAPGGHLPMRNKQYICKKCGQPKRLDTGHSSIRGVSYCAAFEGQAVEEWMKKMNNKEGM